MVKRQRIVGGIGVLLLIGVGVAFLIIGLRLSKDEMRKRSGTEINVLPEPYDDAEKIESDPTVPKTYQVESLARVRNQGSCGSCWAFAVASALEDVWSKRMNNSSRVSELSPQWMLNCWSGYGGRTNKCESGNTLDSAMQIATNPIATESMVPYVAGNYPKCGSGCFLNSCGGESDTNIAFTKVRPIRYVGDLQETVNEIKREIIKNGPVVAGMIVYDNFPNGLTYGVYEGGKENSEVLGGHAVKIVGWGEDEKGGYWTIQNSWGLAWGNVTTPGFLAMRMGSNVYIEQYVYCGIV